MMFRLIDSRYIHTKCMLFLWLPFRANAGYMYGKQNLAFIPFFGYPELLFWISRMKHLFRISEITFLDTHNNYFER